MADVKDGMHAMGTTTIRMDVTHAADVKDGLHTMGTTTIRMDGLAIAINDVPYAPLHNHTPENVPPVRGSLPYKALTAAQLP